VSTSRLLALPAVAMAVAAAATISAAAPVFLDEYTTSGAVPAATRGVGRLKPA